MFKRIYLKLTLRLEVFTHIVPLPFGIYFSVVTGSGSYISKNEMSIVVLAGIINATVLIILGCAWRWFYLKDIFLDIQSIYKDQSISDAERVKLKIRLLRYPFKEAKIIVLRWITGLIGSHLLIILVAGVRPGLHLTGPFLFIMITPISYIAYYFISENVIRKIFRLRKIKEIEIGMEQIPQFSSFQRITFSMVAITIMPVVVLSYMLFGFKTGLVKLEDPVLHLSIMSILFPIPIIIVGYLVAKTFRSGISETSDHLIQLGKGNFSIVSMPTSSDDFGIQAYSLNQIIKQLNSMYSEIKYLNSNLEQKVNDRTFSLERAKSKIETLIEITKTINLNLDIERIMNTLIEYLDQKYNINVCALYIINQQERAIENYYLNIPEQISSSLKETAKSIKFTLDGDATHVHGYVYKTRTAFYTQTLRPAEDEFEKILINELKLRSTLVIPLFIQNEVIGFLDLSRTNEELTLSEEDIDSLITLSNQITGAINNSKLMQQTAQAMLETEKAKEDLEGLNKLIRNLNSVSNLTDVMTFLIYFLEKKWNYTDTSLWLIDNEKQEFNNFCFVSSIVSQKATSQFRGLRLPIQESSGTLFQAYSTREPLYVTISQVDDLHSFDREVAEIANFRYFFQIPLIIYGEVIGILCLHKSRAIELISSEEQIILKKLSEQIAGSIQNSNLYKISQSAKEQADIERGIAMLAQKEAEYERGKSEKLLLNILPSEIAVELKEKGSVEPVFFESVTIMFTDFKGFTQIAENLAPQELIKELDGCFSQFDKIIEHNNLEKLKTIGDAYMCAGGIPKANTTHAINSCLAALEIQSFMNQIKEIKQMMEFPYWELRLGIHSGPVIAGVVGEKKFAYDVWGDTVNTASRMESSGTPSKINISSTTHELVKDFFDCEFRGLVKAKNKGEVAMYYLNGIKKEYSKEEKGLVPNITFWETYWGI